MTQTAPAGTLPERLAEVARQHEDAVRYWVEGIGAGVLTIEVWHPDGRRADVTCMLDADDLDPDTFTTRYLEVAGQAIVGQLRKWAAEGVAAGAS